MLTVRDLMRAGPLTLEPDDSLRTAVDVLVESGTGGAPVVSGGELVGVVSLSDVLAFEADANLVGYRPAPSLDGLSEVAGDERPGRWFTDRWDGVASDVVSHLALFHSPEWEALDSHSVTEVMTRKVVSVTPDATIREAAAIMDRAKVHRLVVTRHGELVGVLGARDIVHAVACGDLIPAPDFEAGGLP